jgi:NADH:ubiquinone oxidoreductase subunit C
VTVDADSLRARFPDAAEVGTSADAIPYVRVALTALIDTVAAVRGPLGYARFVDLTAVDRLAREERFELVYLFYSMTEHAWLRLKTRTDVEAPSVTPVVVGADWYEREVWDLFGVRFVGHPDLRRIMLPDEWPGHPLRRTEPLGSEPVDFTVTRQVYGRD